MRNYYIAGNWKMHKTRAEAAAQDLVAPSFTALETVASVLKGRHILLGAQNMAAVVERMFLRLKGLRGIGRR